MTHQLGRYLRADATASHADPGIIRAFGPLDIVIILVALFAALVWIPVMRHAAPATVAIYRDNRLFGEYPVTERREIRVPGAVGDLLVRIDSSGVRIAHATCPRQICVKSGTIRRAGNQIVCAPNHVLVEIRARTSQVELDGIAR